MALFIHLPGDCFRRCITGVEDEILVPLLRQINQYAGRGGGDGEIQRGAQDFRLHGGIAHTPEGIPHGEIDEKTAWRTYQRGDIAPGGNIDGRYAGFFNNSRDQTHGLMVERSSRNGDQQIDGVGL